jgi:hypothetical protein
MAAPNNNKFWKIRSRHGRKSLFGSPDKMMEAAEEYFEWCEANPLIEIDFKGKDATKVSIPKARPFTMEGLCCYLGCSASYFRTFKYTLKKGEYVGDGGELHTYEDFLTVLTRIEEIIFNQQYTGAVAGFFNPNIVARRLGITEKTEETITVTAYRIGYKDEDGRELPEGEAPLSLEDF